MTLVSVAQPVAFHRPVQHPSAVGPWTVEAVQALLDKPFMDLLFQAQTVHRQHWPEGDIELATLLSVKTGGCPEDCGYCPQSAKYDTGVQASKLMALEDVLFAARRAKDAGATRFCMGAAWREPKDRDVEKVAELVRGVKDLGLETCATLGMLKEEQAKKEQAKKEQLPESSVPAAPRIQPSKREPCLNEASHWLRNSAS